MAANEISSTARRHRVAVNAGDVLARNGIVAMLSGHAELEPLPSYQDSDADVVVVVRRGGDVVDVLREMTRRARPLFVAVARDHRAIDLFTAAELGLVSVVPLRDVTAETLGAAVLTACSGGVHLPPDSQAALLAHLRRVKTDLLEPRGLNLHGLDTREIELLRLLAEGWDLREIGEKLGYSERTMKNVLHMLTTRLGLRNRTHAVAYAIRTGAI